MYFDKIEKLKDRLNALSMNQNEKITKALDIEYTYESNKIEGNTLTLKETALVIEKGLAVGGKTLNEHLEAINHFFAIDYIKEVATSKESITERIISNIHSLILKGIDDKNSGKYRDVQVLISGAKHEPPQPYKVPLQMRELLKWYNYNKDKLHPIALSAEMHERLVTIHPFIDGNGRTSRLLMNLILLQHGYPIAILKGDSKSRLTYYNTLEIAQTENNKEPFINFIAENIETSLQRIIKIIDIR